MTLVCKECKEPFESERSAREYCGRACSNRSANRKAAATANARQRIVVWSCGGGVDSTAIAALIVNGVLPKPDIAVIVDVGWEKQTTWDYLREVMSPKLRSVGVELQIIRTTDFTGNWFFDDNGRCVIPAYRRTDDGVVIKLDTRCSGPWKLRVVKKWLREQGVKACENWVGIAADETHRAKASPDQWFQLRFPLIELGMAREDCQFYLGKLGWPKPFRSSCVICPQMSDREWIELRHERPEEFDRAIKIEQQIRAVDPYIYLHRSGRPLSEVAMDQRDRFPRFPCVCFTKPALEAATA